jgi:hypothetical protein
MEAAKRTGGSVVVHISPEGRVTVGETYSHEDSDPWLKRLKSQGFWIMRLPGFSYFIESLKSEAADGNWMSVIEFLRANTEVERPLLHPAAPSVRTAEEPREPSAPSEWKLSDFLLALPPHPLLPRGLFKE